MEDLKSTLGLSIGDKVFMYFYDSIDGSGIFGENSFYVYKEREVISVDSGVYIVSDGISEDKVSEVANGYGTVLNKPILHIRVSDNNCGNTVSYLLNTDSYLTAEEFKEMLCNDVQRKLSTVKAFNTNCIKE